MPHELRYVEFDSILQYKDELKEEAKRNQIKAAEIWPKRLKQLKKIYYNRNFASMKNINTYIEA